MSKFGAGIRGAWQAATKIDKGKWNGLNGEYTHAKNQIAGLKRWGTAITGPLETRVLEIDDKVAKGHHTDACKLLKELQTFVGNNMQSQTDGKSDFENKYNPLLPKITKIKDLDRKIPAVLKTAQTTVGNLHKAITDEVALGGYLAAKALLPAFENVLNPTHVSALALLNARKDVRAGLKPIAKRLKTARDLAKANAPAQATEIGAFNIAFKAFHDEEKLYKYVQAKPLLPALVTAVGNLVKAHNAALVTAADTPDKARDAIEQLDEQDLKELTSTQQMGLLAKMREGKTRTQYRADPRLLGARCKVLLNMEMNPQFLAKDKIKRDAVVTALKDDPKVTQAKSDWNDPVKMTPEKKKEFVNYVLQKQLDALKPPDLAMPTMDFTNTARQPNGTVNLGGFNGPPVPGKLTVNMHDDAKFDDFNEVMDTVLHENTHNYQAHLVAMYTAKPTSTLPPEIANDPDVMDQIKMFAENEEIYIGSDPDGYKGTYKKQPYEEHAYMAGNYLSKQILS